MAAAIKRKSISLTERDLADLAKLRGSAELRSTLAELARTPLEDDPSDAALLHLAILAGLQAARDRQNELSYAAEAEDREHSDELRRIARRLRARQAMAEADDQ